LLAKYNATSPKSSGVYELGSGLFYKKARYALKELFGNDIIHDKSLRRVMAFFTAPLSFSADNTLDVTFTCEDDLQKPDLSKSVTMPCKNGYSSEHVSLRDRAFIVQFGNFTELKTVAVEVATVQRVR
jgi:hypothetical protein